MPRGKSKIPNRKTIIDLAEEKEASETKIAASNEPKTPNQGAFSKLNRSLTEEDLSNPSVSRMLLNTIDLLTTEKLELSVFRGKFYQADKECAVLTEKNSGENKFQILYSLVLAIAGIIIGAAFTAKGVVFWLLIGCGIVLLAVGGILSFFINKK